MYVSESLTLCLPISIYIHIYICMYIHTYIYVYINTRNLGCALPCLDSFQASGLVLGRSKHKVWSVQELYHVYTVAMLTLHTCYASHTCSRPKQCMHTHYCTQCNTVCDCIHWANADLTQQTSIDACLNYVSKTSPNPQLQRYIRLGVFSEIAKTSFVT